ncbi:hypothetical protein [Alteribacillus sp. HJP-4]|uniref:hypothetical protein n=1 Tax=Alteribacillus sp. HJP-4 TaxID=2775394 RepID=UPI0035CCCA00
MSRRFYFFLGLIVVLLLLPILYSLGLPSFDALLTNLLGEGKILWAIIISMGVISLTILYLRKHINLN